LADSDEEDDGDDEYDDDNQPVVESLSSEEAWRLPIVGSIVLGTLYLAIKFLDKVWVNRLLGAYFSIAGVLVSAKTGSMIVHGAMKIVKMKSLDKYKILVTRKSQGEERCEIDTCKADSIPFVEILRVKIDSIDVVFGVLATGLCGFYSLTYNWIACNAIALSFAFNAIRWLSLDSFRTGIIVLLTLLVYDITWVFGGDVMVTVAKSFEAPIKVVFPKNFAEIALYQIKGLSSLRGTKDSDGIWTLFSKHLSQSPKTKMTMLGLGDIVVPGLFISLALSFDMKMAASSNPGSKLTRRSPLTQWERPYFRATMIAYVVGLSVTIGIMHFAKAAQPALLYLSPACVLAVLITASARNELKDLWEYTNTEESDQEEKKPGATEKSGVDKTRVKEDTSELSKVDEKTTTDPALESPAQSNGLETSISNTKNKSKKSKKR